MSPYRYIIRGLRMLMAALVIVTLLAAVVPFLRFQMKAAAQTQVALFRETDKANDGVNWILNNQKARVIKDAPADLIIINTVKNFQETVGKNVNHNIMVMEMLCSKMGMETEDQRLVRQLTGAEFTGFVGKTFLDLGNTEEIPARLIQLYEEQYTNKWTFSGEGVVIFSEEDVLVLQKGKDYAGRLMLTEGALKVPYSGYFEIINSKDAPLAELKLKTTETGAKRLAGYGMNGSFPALMHTSSPLYDAYYYSVSMGDQRVDVPASYDSIAYLMRHKGVYNRMTDEKAYWKWYVPRLTSLLYTKHAYDWTASQQRDTHTFSADNARIFSSDILGNKKPFFIKGINLGAALPGTAFTEFPQDKKTYLQWMEQMQRLNVNTVRVYTLLPPVFYEALYDHNKGRGEPLYLLQEIWPEEHPDRSDYLSEAYNKDYQKEIAWTVSALHGDANIPKRDYRAYGLYHSDVSDYVLGYLAGREMEPQEVTATDQRNQGYAFKGEYFYSEPEASPTEAWLAASCDYVLDFENERYGDAHLTAIVSWPTLDTLSHDSEWNSSGDKTLQYNDSISVDIGNIGINKGRVPGFFGAYHIYPNYPDFMNLDPEYAAYNDAAGRFRYGGYLKAFMAQHTRYPAVVAEYGISTSMESAHYSPDGLHHGGLSEQEQAQGIVRMTEGILREGYSGAVVFEWMDEWAKKTWTTEPYMIPYGRHLLWHNALDPEQNYGLLAYRESDPAYGADRNNGTLQGIETIRIGQNEAYLFMEIGFADGADIQKPFELTLSTDSERGAQDNEEFLLKWNAAPELLVNPGYNWTKGRYQAVDAEFEAYEPLEQMTNKENITKSGIRTPAVTQNLSRLRIGTFQIPQNHIQVDGNHLVIRLPYGLLGISDPSSQTILSDARQHVTTELDSINTVKNERLRFQLVMDDNILSFTEKMTSWEAPTYRPELKSGVPVLAEMFKTLP